MGSVELGIVRLTTEEGDTATAPTAMKNQVTIIVVLTGLLLLQQLGPVDGLKCWSCQNIYPHTVYYDPNCGSSDYEGDADHVDEDDTPGYTCETGVYENGYVYRALQHDDDQVDGDCDVEPGYLTACYCSNDFCNTGLCEDC